MYSKFIEVHDGLQPMSVNVDQIDWFADETISLRSEEVRVYESYDEIKALVEETGSLIHKADPRLDTSTPLTFEDMRGMVGQPVWNSNFDEWGLVIEQEFSDMITVLYDEDKQNYCVRDLIAFPFYRMKQETMMDVLKRESGKKRKK